jgi:hypothetical protein
LLLGLVEDLLPHSCCRILRIRKCPSMNTFATIARPRTKNW